MDFFLPSGKLASVKTRRGVRERERERERETVQEEREREGREKIKKGKKKSRVVELRVSSWGQFYKFQNFRDQNEIFKR